MNEREAMARRFQSIVERLNAIIYESSPDRPYRLLSVNDQIEQALGIPAPDWLEDPDRFSRQLNDHDRGRVLEALAAAAASDAETVIEYRLRDRDGADHWFRDHSWVVREDGATCRRGIMFEITQQVSGADAIMARRLEELRQAGEILAGVTDTSAVLRRLAAYAKDLMHADFAALSLFREDSPFLERFVFVGMDDAMVRHLGSPPTGRGLLGMLSQQTRAVRLTDLREHPTFTGWPEGHPEMGPFLGVPIRLNEVPLGAMYLTRNAGSEPFSDADELRATSLALQATAVVASAIESARSESLALAEERERIAHDLHDGIVQSLYALGLNLNLLLSDKSISPAAHEIFELGVESINTILRDIREYIDVLETEVTTSLPDFGSDLQRILRQMVPAEVEVLSSTAFSAVQALSGRQVENLLYLVREAVSNAIRHGKPNKIAIDVRQVGDQIAVTVQDNGQGFDLAGAGTGLGSVTMHTRAERLGGELTVISIPGMGTTVRVLIPDPRSLDDSAAAQATV